jgi:hypothetical protein
MRFSDKNTFVPRMITVFLKFYIECQFDCAMIFKFEADSTYSVNMRMIFSVTPGQYLRNCYLLVLSPIVMFNNTNILKFCPIKGYNKLLEKKSSIFCLLQLMRGLKLCVFAKL